MNTVTYAVTGMTCGHCELSVREEVSGVAGVQDVEVSATAGTLIVTSSGPVDDAQILRAVDEAGYSAFDGVVNKPIDIRQLAEVLNVVLNPQADLLWEAAVG